MRKEFEDFPNWIFEVNEISAGVYNIKGRNETFGSNFDLTGTHLEELFEQARETASQMDKQPRRGLN